MILDPVEILGRLVAIPSVNPAGRTMSDATSGEARLTDFLATLCRQIGLATHRQTVAPGRDNLLAWLDGAPAVGEQDTVLLFDAHQDTVPVDNMTIDPFQADVREGRLYGRGACDTKGGMAAVLVAVARLAHERPTPRPTVVVSFTINEEYGFDGARQLAALWRDASHQAIPRRPDAAVVLEPTALDVVVAHKGVIRWRCCVHGRAGHSARPVAADNAIYTMARAVASIEAYAAQLSAGPAHPLCGPATVSVGTIHGGAAANIVPERCTIEIDYRVPPSEQTAAGRQRLIDHLTESVATQYPLEHESAFMAAAPLCDQGNGALADALERAVQAVGVAPRRVGVPYATNGAFFAEIGVPTVVFGPGNLAQAHAADEWIALDQLHSATEAIFGLTADWGVC